MFSFVGQGRLGNQSESIYNIYKFQCVSACNCSCWLLSARVCMHLFCMFSFDLSGFSLDLAQFCFLSVCVCIRVRLSSVHAGLFHVASVSSIVFILYC